MIIAKSSLQKPLYEPDNQARFKQKSRGFLVLCLLQHVGVVVIAQPKRPTIMLEG